MGANLATTAVTQIIFNHICRHISSCLCNNHLVLLQSCIAEKMLTRRRRRTPPPPALGRPLQQPDCQPEDRPSPTPHPPNTSSSIHIFLSVCLSACLSVCLSPLSPSLSLYQTRSLAPICPSRRVRSPLSAEITYRMYICIDICMPHTINIAV